MNAADVIGWTMDSGDMFCPDCAPTNDEEKAKPIFADSETDSPSHCVECEALIPEQLTSAGADNVKEAFECYLIRREGRAEILSQWAAEFKCWSIHEEGEVFRDLVERATSEDNLKAAMCNEARNLIDRLEE